MDTKRRLLIVEDVPEQAQFLAGCLPDFEVEVAGSARETRLKLYSHRDKPFSAVVLDLGLPDSKGIETALVLQQLFPDMPLIVVTGMPPEEIETVVVRRAGAQNVHTVIRKPISPEKVRAALIEAISYRESVAETKEVREDVADIRSSLAKAIEASDSIVKKGKPPCSPLRALFMPSFISWFWGSSAGS
jgi:DNA-binding response OmpR family regulator